VKPEASSEDWWDALCRWADEQPTPFWVFASIVLLVVLFKGCEARIQIESHPSRDEATDPTK
jgi:hypothetical protein